MSTNLDGGAGRRALMRLCLWTGFSLVGVGSGAWSRGLTVLAVRWTVGWFIDRGSVGWGAVC